MRLLAVETSGPRGGVALAEGTGGPVPADAAAPTAGPMAIVREVLLAEGLRHARDLVATIKEACLAAGWDRRRIDVVAVSIGPGSFTGVRIAVTLAKFMAWDTGAKVVAVPSFRALAANAPPDRPRVATIIDAKRGGLFASIFERRDVPSPAQGASPLPAPGADPSLAPRVSGGSDPLPAPRVSGGSNRGASPPLAETFGPALIEAEDLARRLEKPAFILGHGIIKGRAALEGFELAPETLWDARPASVARLGWEMHERGEYADPLRLEPVYIRPPEAQEIWERRQRQAGDWRP